MVRISKTIRHNSQLTYGEAHEDDVCIGVREWAESVVVFLTGGIPQCQLDLQIEDEFVVKLWFGCNFWTLRGGQLSACSMRLFWISGQKISTTWHKMWLISPVSHRPQCRRRSSRRQWAHTLPGTGPCWRQSAGTSSRTRRRPRSRASFGWPPYWSHWRENCRCRFNHAEKGTKYGYYRSTRNRST